MIGPVRLHAVAGLLALLPACATSGQPPAIPVHDATTPVPRTGRMSERHELINARVAAARDPQMVFVGDSITQGWEGAGADVWEAYYARRGALNLGVSGDRTQHVLWRLENGNVAGLSPAVAVVMIGTNNSRDNSSREIADGITAIVTSLRGKLPRTRILLLAIFPRGEDATDPRRLTNGQVNDLIAGLAVDRMVDFLDIGDAFLDPDGTLSREIMPDLLHLSPAGYRIWAEAMEPALARLLPR